jgi:hypothetical protein
MIFQSEVDWLLENLAIGVSGTERAIPITLLVGGVSISGQLVSAHKYMDQIHDMVVFKDEMTRVEDIDMQNAMLSFMIKRNSANCVKEKDAVVKSAGYIHIQNAVFHGGTSRKGVFWRGKIEAVDGFHLGA